MKQLKLDQAIRNLTFGDLENLLVVIGLGVIGLEKTGVVHLLGFTGGRGEKWWCDFGVNGMEFMDTIMLPCFREVKCLNNLKLCLVGKYLEPLKHLKEHPPAEQSK